MRFILHMINWSQEKQKYEVNYLIKGGRKKLSLKSNIDLRIPLKYDAIIVFLLVMLFILQYLYRKTVQIMLRNFCF